MWKRMLENWSLWDVVVKKPVEDWLDRIPYDDVFDRVMAKKSLLWGIAQRKRRWICTFWGKKSRPLVDGCGGSCGRHRTWKGKGKFQLLDDLNDLREWLKTDEAGLSPTTETNLLATEYIGLWFCVMNDSQSHSECTGFESRRSLAPRQLTIVYSSDRYRFCFRTVVCELTCYVSIVM